MRSPGRTERSGDFPGDLPCIPTKRNNLTNHRASTKDISVALTTPRKMSLEQANEWIDAGELVELTSTSIRMRKAILNADQHKKLLKQ